MTNEQLTDIFCAMCRCEHRATVSLGEGDFPRVRWLTPHVAEWPSRGDHIGETVRGLVELAGQLMAHAVDVGDWSLVEYAAGSALELRDES